MYSMFTLTADLPGSKSWTRYLANLAFNRPKWYSVAMRAVQLRQMGVAYPVSLSVATKGYILFPCGLLRKTNVCHFHP